MNTYECIFDVKSSPIEIKKKMNIKHFITNTLFKIDYLMDNFIYKSIGFINY